MDYRLARPLLRRQAAHKAPIVAARFRESWSSSCETSPTMSRRLKHVSSARSRVKPERLSALVFRNSGMISLAAQFRGFCIAAPCNRVPCSSGLSLICLRIEGITRDTRNSWSVSYFDTLNRGRGSWLRNVSYSSKCLMSFSLFRANLRWTALSFFSIRSRVIASGKPIVLVAQSLAADHQGHR